MPHPAVVGDLSLRAGKERASLARYVGRGVGGVGVGMGHASLARYEGGGDSRAGKERGSLARCVGRALAKLVMASGMHR